MASQVVAAPAQQQPTTRPGAAVGANWTEEQKERFRWEQLIEFFGDGNLGTWSLRIRDANAKERATFRYLGLWKYDLAARKWVKVDDGPADSPIVPPNEKGGNAPYPDTQLLVELPLKVDDLGLYYAKWRVNKTEGGTFTRLGPSAVTRQVTPLPTRVPDGMIVTIVPLDKNNAERQLIPNPRLHANLPNEPAASNPAAPATRPRQ